MVSATVATLSKGVFGAPHKDKHDLKYSRPIAIASRPENTLPQFKSLKTARLEPGVMAISSYTVSDRAIEIINQLRRRSFCLAFFAEWVIS